MERWWSKTHIIHLTCGEITITLKNVALLLGLPINGNKVIRQTFGLGIVLCEELLCDVLLHEQRKCQQISLIWLQQTFGVLPYDTSQQQIDCCAHVYILRLIVVS